MFSNKEKKRDYGNCEVVRNPRRGQSTQIHKVPCVAPALQGRVFIQRSGWLKNGNRNTIFNHGRHPPSLRLWRTSGRKGEEKYYFALLIGGLSLKMNQRGV